VLTEFTELDEVTNGLHNSELVVLAARPSMGKTAFALDITNNVAIKQQIPVLFVSLEMSSVELADRLLSSAAGVNGQRMRSGTLSRDDHRKLIETSDRIYAAPLYIDDSPGRRVNEIAAAARRIKRREGRLGLIAIDYLQLIEPENPSDPRQEQVARMTRSTSDLGEQLDSMADMVTFGVAPAFAALMLVNIAAPFGGGRGDSYFDRLGMVAALIYVACTALRLARFNIELGSEEQPDHNNFKGLPSPGAAGTVASLILLHQSFLDNNRPDWIVNAASFGMIVVLLLTAFAMVSQLHYVHVLNRYVRGRAPFATVVKGVVLGLFLVIEFQATLAAALIFYALSAPVVEGWRWLWRRHKPGGAR